MNEMRIDSVLGEVRLIADAEQLHAICFSGQAFEYAGPTQVRATPVLQAAADWLQLALSGQAHAAPPPMTLAALGTAFQQQVWTALLEVPAGSSVSYGALASRLGRPTAVRALGAAVGRNPWSVLVPCHRVLGADGALTGYAGGLGRKRALLALETGQALPWVQVQSSYATQYRQPLQLRAGDAVRWQARPDDGEYPGWSFALDATGTGGWVPRHWFSDQADGGRCKRSYTSRELDVDVGDLVLPLDTLGGWAYARHRDGRTGWLPESVLRQAR